MKKLFINVFLCGALVLSTGTFTSCDYDDDELKSRMSVIEVAVADLKAQLANALTTGASIVDAKQDANGVWTLKLSNNQTIVIKGSTGGGGGSDVTVVDNGTSFTITVNGTEYVIPKGAAVNSLVYSPEYADGIVVIGNAGANVKLLATPVVSGDALKNATFNIAEAHKLATRAGSDLFEINGDVTLDGDLLVVPVKATEIVEPGASYAVSILMNVGGTSISSNYFTMKVSEQFSVDVPEEIGGFEIKSEYSPKELADGFSELTIKGGALLKITDFKDLFSTLPANAEFSIARKVQQPGGHAQEKYDILSNSLAKSGAWGFSQRPGTSFNDNKDRPGFLIIISSEGVIKAKIYVVINDELAGVNFVGLFNTQAEAEWGGREKFLPMGAQVLDIQQMFNEYETEFPIIHGGKDEFFGNWLKYMVTLEDDGDVIYNDSEKLVLGEVGKDYAAGSRGIYWFNHGFAIYVPEALATENGKYRGSDDKLYSGGEGYGYDFWGRGVGEGDPWNVVIDPVTAKVSIPETYTGYGLRLGIGAAYEYAYGDKRLSSADQMGLFFFNRRLAPEGATMPAPKP
ncbi:hypothetical protein LJC21_01685 [Bacteroides sp. OttesenSCG-928-E20]|nr:hypothetical protein [Bacteroides sp. OttesenSCG-928-E20]MDL2304827.1 hypothetical protein [Bacteroides sp. OttesenSCG-928-D19]